MVGERGSHSNNDILNVCRVRKCFVVVGTLIGLKVEGDWKWGKGLENCGGVVRHDLVG